MLTLENEGMSLQMAEDYSSVSLFDRRRGTTWRLDTNRLGYRREASGPQEPLRGGCVTREGDALLATFRLPEGVIAYRWRLGADHVAVELRAQTPGIECITLPGAFAPVGEPLELALPIYQGVLIRQETAAYEARSTSGGHGSFSMAMAGLLAERGGLLIAEGSIANWAGVYGADAAGLYFTFEQSRCPVEGWAPHSVGLYPTDATVAAVCRQFRAHLEERRAIVTWEEKIARKPILSQLFGGLMAFTGYNRAPGLDYAACVRRLRDYGFASLLLYPVRMCHYTLDFRMGGDDPVWLTDEEIAAVKAIPGAMVAPWGWVFEALDDGSEARRGIFRRDHEGDITPNWRIEQYRWYPVCTPYQRAHIMARFAGDMQAMDWIHFDVNATWPPQPCFSEEHALHGHRPLGRQADVRHVQELLGPDTVGNRIVSSEGFVGHYTAQYDIGSTKMVPGPDLATKTPVPMTMLVFHDCCVHDWWELHNYNETPGWPMKEARQGFGLVGSGRPALKAALDALYGCPPNVFPFGRQYAWVSWETRETFSYTVSLDDAAVQEALREALPVARLHGQIGRHQMADFRFLSEDRALQATRFSDGTEVVTNLGREPREVAGYGLLPGASWRCRRA